MDLTRCKSEGSEPAAAPSGFHIRLGIFCFCVCCRFVFVKVKMEGLDSLEKGRRELKGANLSAMEELFSRMGRSLEVGTKVGGLEEPMAHNREMEMMGR
ncbi:hypothetical protein SESBI_22174 [Sesbania bispinosa]|nr:hypothetical protein SESBI_22174 [Sesbania bispinosa]